MSYLTQEQLKQMKFKHLGENVKISDKASIYNCEKIVIGDNSRIDDYCVISGKVEIGKYCHITPMCLIAGGDPGVFMADFCTLAYGVKVFAQSDDYTGSSLTNSLIPKKYKDELYSLVTLEKHVIVGTNSVIFPGVVIGEGCAIGAMSLVNKNTDPWGVYFGTPALRVKSRLKDILKLERDFLRNRNDII